MRAFALMFLLVSALCVSVYFQKGVETKTGATAKSLTTDPAKETATEDKPATKVDFSTQIKPVLQAKCQPCHFSGGKVYAQMPFDRPETIRTLGTKLFTRIKDENERRLIRDFLAQP